MKKIILDTIDDTLSRFFFYDRKNDERLPLGAIGEAVKNGEITAEEIAQEFERIIREALR